MKDNSVIAMILMALSLLFGITFSSCNPEKGNGKYSVENHQAGSFHKVSISSSTAHFQLFGINSESPDLQIRLIQDGQEFVSVETDENLQEYIDIDNSGDELEIKLLKPIFSKKDVHVFVHFKNLDLIECNGVANLESKDTLRLKSLKASSSGSCDFDLILSLDELDLDISGTGNVKLAGKANQFNTNASGSVEVLANQFLVKTANLDISGSGQAELNVEEKLKVDISGSADVKYKGNPSLSKDISGSANISHVN